MTTRNARRWAVCAVAVAAACIPEKVSYGPAQDDRAMAAIASAWAEQGGLALSMCEDVARSQAWAGPDCQVDHAVRGGGLGRTHTEEHGGVGCGGCLFVTQAFVRAVAEGGGLAGSTQLTGVVTLGNYHDPYDVPYSLSLRCVDQAQPCDVSGTIEADGTLRVTVKTGAETGAGEAHVLGRAGAAACP